MRAGASGCQAVSTVADLGPYLGTVMAALPAEDPTIAGPRIRLAEVMIDTARDIVTGRLRAQVLEAADAYKEIARNDLEEMSLASPAIAGGAIYIRTETRLYRIGA